MKQLMIVLAVAGMALSAWGCTRESLQNSTSIKQNGIEYYLETDKSGYKLGEGVTILYRLTNTTGEVKDLGMVIDCEYCLRQITITTGNKEIWKTCRIPPPCGQKEFRLDPHGSWEYSETWNMVNDNGTLEPEDDFPIRGRGEYEVTAELQGIKISLWIKIK